MVISITMLSITTACYYGILLLVVGKLHEGSISAAVIYQYGDIYRDMK